MLYCTSTGTYKTDIFFYFVCIYRHIYWYIYRYMYICHTKPVGTLYNVVLTRVLF